MKIIYFGSDNSFSQVPLVSLLHSKHGVCAFAYDDIDSDFGVIKSDSIQSIASKKSIPLIKIGRDYNKIIPQLKLYEPDVILVSCYSRLLPASIIEIAKVGCFNVHPSLLPSFRGPVPLFWQFREGVEYFGVTLHRVTTNFDSGNIVGQIKVKIEEGISKNTVTNLLANKSVGLIFKMLDDIKNGCLVEIEQDETKASHQSFPKKTDYNIDISWTAKRIYNFISAYKGNGVIFQCEVDKNTYEVIDAYSYQNTPYEESIKQEKGTLVLSCGTGYILCKIVMK